MQKVFFSLMVSLLLTMGCADSRQAEFYGNIFSPTSGFLLTQDNHPTGWTQTSCFSCHFPDNIHLVDNVTEFPVNVDEIQRIVREKGLQSCQVCHGDNGSNL